VPSPAANGISVVPLRLREGTHLIRGRGHVDASAGAGNGKK
jgi:hypothetical protein